MEILSRTFLILFLPLSLIGYWLVIKKQRARLWVLFLLSMLFYALGGWQFIPLLLGLSLATYWLAHKKAFGVGVILNLLALGIFKYLDFGVDYLNLISARLNLPILLPIMSLALPLGLSYYVFKHIGYLVDIKKERYPAANDLLAFLTYSSFFPQISAGPLSSFKDTGGQLQALPAKLTSEQFYYGLLHIGMGIAKKVLLAEPLVKLMGLHYFTPERFNIGLVTAWTYIIIQGIQLYLDFSGYTDIVLGIGLLFGVSLPPNFDSPYLATTPRSFWERWHISLSQWFRIYLFSPLSRTLLQKWGQTKKGTAQFTANIVTMGLVGLWHGPSEWFVLWGIYHGMLLNIHSWITKKDRHWVVSWIGQVMTFISVMFGWSLFFSTGKGSFYRLFMNLLGFGGFGSVSKLMDAIPKGHYIPLIASLIITFSGFAEAEKLKLVKQRWFPALVGVLLAILILLLGQPSDFTYVRF